MALVNFQEVMKPYRPLSVSHVGTVVSNDDPKMLGAIKVRIPELLDFPDVERLPWVFPARSYFVGGSADSATLFVPEVGATIIVMFPSEDIYAGIYANHFHSEETINAVLGRDNYPDVWGLHDSTGTYLKVDKQSGQMDIHHQSEYHRTVDTDGNEAVTVPQSRETDIGKDEILAIEENRKKTVGGDEDGEITGDQKESIGGDAEQTVQGGRTRSVQGDESVAIQGGQELSIQGDRTISIQGNAEASVVGDETRKIQGMFA